MSLRDARSKRQAANEVKAIIRDFLYSLRRVENAAQHKRSKDAPV